MTTQPSADPPLEIDVHAVKAMLDRGENFLLLDCRETDEFELVHIAQAKLIPMSELMIRVNELEPCLWWSTAIMVEGVYRLRNGCGDADSLKPKT